MAEECTYSVPFQWNEKRSEVALFLAQGYTWDETIKECGIARGTLANWKRHPDFAAEVDRLSMMVDIAGRAQRLRIAMKIVRDKGLSSERDLLDWLKYAQGETDGVRLDLAKLVAAIDTAEAPLADSRSNGTGAEQAAPISIEGE